MPQWPKHSQGQKEPRPDLPHAISINLGSRGPSCELCSLAQWLGLASDAQGDLQFMLDNVYVAIIYLEIIDLAIILGNLCLTFRVT